MTHFIIEELVSKELFKLKTEEELWKLFSPEILESLAFIREKLGKRITVNNWHKGGVFNNRGFRPKNCKIGAKNSAHKEGKAIDFDVEDMTAEEVRDWLIENQDELPYPLRYEKDVSWVHIDTRNNTNEKLYGFSV